MKKILLLTAVAGIAMTGCVKNEVYVSEAEKTGPKIAFESPFLYGNRTKANVLGELNDAKYPQNENFIIFACQHESDFDGWPQSGSTVAPTSTDPGICDFSGKEISYNASFDAWIPTYEKDGESEYYYWPQGLKLSFSAMSPADGVNGYSYGKNGLQIQDFENPGVGQQFDLMFAKRITNQSSSNMINSASSYSGIPISFQHALASLHFSIDKESEEQNVSLISVTLTNVIKTGSFFEDIDEDAKDYVIDSKDSENTVTPYWDVEGSPTTNYVTFDSTIPTDDEKNMELALPFPVSPRYITDWLNVMQENNDTYDNAISSSLLVIPQEISTDVKLIIRYAVNGVEMNAKEVKLRGLSTITTEGDGIPNGIKNDSVITWERGHKYTYRIHYSQASEKKDIIYFAPSVEGWKDMQVIEITL